MSEAFERAWDDRYAGAGFGEAPDSARPFIAADRTGFQSGWNAAVGFARRACQEWDPSDHDRPLKDWEVADEIERRIRAAEAK